MEENNSPKFHFSGDDEAPEAIRQDELREMKIEKLGQRVTLLTVLIPCMIGVIMVIAYLDIKDRVTRSHDTGTIGVQKLSKDLASKFSSLSLEQAKIKDLQAKKLPELEKSAAFLKSKLSKVQKSLTQMSQSMVNRDELTRVVENLNQKVNEIPESLSSDLDALASDLGTLAAADDQIMAEGNQRSIAIKSLSDGLAQTQVGIDTLRQEITNFAEHAIDKGELELALKLKEIAYRQLLLDKTTQMEKELQSLRKEIKILQESGTPSSGEAPAGQTVPPAVKKPTPQATVQQPSDSKPAATSNSQPTNTEPGAIVEQTIE